MHAYLPYFVVTHPCKLPKSSLFLNAYVSYDGCQEQPARQGCKADVRDGADMISSNFFHNSHKYIKCSAKPNQITITSWRT
jgi:hypothetical protein